MKMKVKDEVELKVMEGENDKEEASAEDDSAKGGNDSSEDDDDDSVLSPPVKRKRGGGRKSSLTKNLSEADLTCPHCQKVFISKLGLDYHVNNFVCRSTLRPGGPVVKGKRKKSVSSGGGTKDQTYKKIRGKLVDRTCLKCNRVFTSALGLNYHRGTSIK
jgi:hypothetical protein